jgi:hypothetical protein
VASGGSCSGWLAEGRAEVEAGVRVDDDILGGSNAIGGKLGIHGHGALDQRERDWAEFEMPPG